MATDSAPRRVGIVGFGKLGQYLVDAIVKGDAPGLEVAFVWNRSPERVDESELVRDDQHCRDLSDFARFKADLIVEVAHPEVTREFGPSFVRAADFMIGSPTALGDRDIERSLHEAVAEGPGFGVYVPSGALWGAQDLRKMADRGQLAALTVTMKKHPGSLKVLGDLVEPCRRAAEAGKGAGEAVLYDGPVRALCSLAPNNVNTMAAAAVAGHTLGMDGVRARLVADCRLDAHVIEIEALGPERADGGERFRVSTERYNPAPPGAVTGKATFGSFVSSMLGARGGGRGVHLC